MKKSIAALALVFAGILLFDFLFWREKMGLNAGLFALFLVGSLAGLFPEARRSRAFWAAAGGAILAAAMVVWHNSAAAKLAFFVASIAAAGFAQTASLRSLFSAAEQFLVSLASPPRRLRAELLTLKKGPTNRLGLSKIVQFAALPLAIVTAFYLLYLLANPRFAELSGRFWAKIWAIFSFDFPLARAAWVVASFFGIGAALLKNDTGIAAIEAAKKDVLERVRRPLFGLGSEPMMALDRERKQGVLLLILLNLLLFLVNLTDVRFVWFGLDSETATDLKGYVHAGTWALIGSILLAMGVLFFFFRGNLNFLKTAGWLRKLAFLWLSQNAILAASVGCRNWRYIDHHGLAYRRIGVFLFLGLTAVGLAALFVKIRDRKSLFWLMRVNGWAFFGLLLANSTVGWDAAITRYNLFTPVKSVIDGYFLLHEVSDKNLRILEENAELLKSKPMYPPLAPEQIDSYLRMKRTDFDRSQSRFSWKSWNAADASNRR